MSRWFRVYEAMVDDPKVQRLPDTAFKTLVNLWCLASQGNGTLPPIADIAFKLRMKPEKVAALISSLQNAELIDEFDDGFVPHNWDRRQFKSDVSTDRVKRHRNAKRNVSPTVSETPPDTDTESDTESEQKRVGSVAGATRPRDEVFEEFWKAYPSRGTASNPKKPARDRFERAVKSGVTPETIIAAAKRFREIEQSAGRAGTDKVAQAVTWLNQQRWGDYAPAPEVTEGDAPGFYAVATSAELQAWDDYRRATEGKTWPKDTRGGWRFPTQWPPSVTEQHESVAPT